MLSEKEYLEEVRKVEHAKKEGKENKESLELICETNKELIKRYPFLLPRNVWTDKVAEWYDYSYTELDAFPDGWRLAFGIQMMDEILEELIKFDFVEEFRILQIKEKFGTLRFYTGGIPRGSRIFDIILKYERMSRDYCFICGKPTKYMSEGWIEYYCEDCAKKIGLENFVKIPKEGDAD